MNPLHHFHLRPEWVGPRRGPVINLLNLFAPREENVVWHMLTRAFRTRVWVAWVFGTIVGMILPILINPSPSQRHPQISFYFPMLMVSLVMFYVILAGAGTAFLRRLRKENSGESIFMAPLDSVQFIRAFQGVFSFVTLTATLLLGLGIAALTYEDWQRSPNWYRAGKEDMEILGLIYAYCYTFVRVYYWSLISRGWFMWLPAFCIGFFAVLVYCGARDYLPNFLTDEESSLWYYPAGMFLLSIAVKHYCRHNYLRIACARLFP